MSQLSLLFAVLLALALGAAATTSKNDAKITSMPGQNFQAKFNQYAGYITVDQAHGRNLFYWFQESQNDPANDPVVLWLNGGPGCSSIGGGALEENGAYRPFVSDSLNQTVGVESEFWAWNKIANIIFLDSPAGVGYSYSDTPSDYLTNNNKTAADSTTFLQIFFTEVFPELANNTFWIAGESYAGVYIPTLAHYILTRSTLPSLVANLRKGGLMLGNPVMGCNGAEFDGAEDILKMGVIMDMLYWHAMVSPRVYSQWTSLNCDTASPSALKQCQTLYATALKSCGSFNQPLKQQQLLEERGKSVATSSRNGQINPDCLYYSFCVGNATLEFMEDTNVGCFSIEDQISAYLNYPDVQAALHARPTKWRSCGGVVFDQIGGNHIVPFLEYFFSNAPTMRILYYSGDIDIKTVPFGETFRCLETMDRPVVDPWKPWGFNNEIAGYVEVYDTYTLATLKGAGHEAPAYQPASAFEMFKAFLNNQPFPNA